MAERARIPVELPLLPGNLFYDPRVANHSKPQTLIKDTHTGSHGVRDVPAHVRPPGEVMGGTAHTGKPPSLAATGMGMSVSATGPSDLGSSSGAIATHPYVLQDPSFKVGAADFQPAPPPPNLQGKILIFYTYFQETVHERRDEQYRVRQCRFLYYLEDDTMEIIERNQPNSGIPQGHLLKRHRVPKDDEGHFYHFSDFVCGAEVPIYGKVFRVVDADDFTKEFLGAMGVDVGTPEEMPGDTYTQARSDVEGALARPIAGVRADPVKKFFEASLGKPTHLLESRDKFPKFLAHDRQVLKFWVQWDESENRSMYTEIHSYLLLYFLSDDTMQLLDLNRTEGKDPWSTFIKRQRVLREYKGPGDFGEREPRSADAYYGIDDLMVGRSINIFGRNMLINSCDDFTREFYMNRGQPESAFEPVYLLRGETPKPSRMPPPPHDGYGTEEDSLQNTKRLVPQPPKKDLAKFIAHDKKVLRFSMRLANPGAGDAEREFILQFYMADDTLGIVERRQRNSGRAEGVFLRRSKVRKNPPTELHPVYWAAEDFQVGMEVTINGFRFIITDVDEFTTNILVGETARFRHSDLDAILRRFRQKLYEKRTKIRDCFRDVDLSKTGEIDFEEFKTALIRNDFLDLTEHEMLMLFRRFAKNNGQTISYEEFVDEILDPDFQNPGGPSRITPSPDVVGMSDAEYAQLAKTAPDRRAQAAQLRQLIKNLRDILFLKRSLFTEALHDLDPKHTGFITQDNFIRGVRKFGVPIDDQLMEKLIEHVYLDVPSGQINYQDFLAKVEYYGRGLEGPRY